MLVATKVLHIILSLAVFFSTTGLTLGHHFCQNEKAGTAVFGISGACHKSTHQACAAGGHCTSEKEDGKNCCHNETQYFQQDLAKQSQFSGLDLLKKPALVAGLQAIFQYQAPASKFHFSTWQNYKPPIVCKDIPLWLQTFLC